MFDDSLMRSPNMHENFTTESIKGVVGKEQADAKACFGWELTFRI